jgi:ABC-type lipoprotein export system ATPase subunit
MITLDNISKDYTISKENKVGAVQGVNLKIDKGEFLVITGHSGSGKTTLLNLASGLTRPSSGRVMLDRVDLWSLSDPQQSRLRSEKFGFIFQFPSLIPTLNALENVVLPTIFTNGHARKAAYQRVEDLMELAGLEDKKPLIPASFLPDSSSES